MEASNQELGDKARLVSSTFTLLNNNTNGCEVRLFYHMHGTNIGNLNVYSRTAIGGVEKLLFKKSGEIGNYWERADIKLTSVQPFQLVIEGVVGNGPYGDIAIDDITFTSGCVTDNNIILPTLIPIPTTTTANICGNNNQFACKTGATLQCIPRSKVCNFEYDCADKSDEAECGTCDFETSWCGWYDSSNDKSVWNRVKSPSQNPQGPQIDHTYTNNTNGYFLITELSDNAGTFVNKALLFGPGQQGTSEFCKLSLWINMNDPKARASFFYSNVSNLYNFKSLGSLTGYGNKNWYNLIFDIGKSPANYQVEVIAYPNYVNDLNYTDIAIDDAEFIDCAINTVLSDKSLECDFEKNLCYYFNDLKADLSWTRKANSSYYTQSGPSFDHTTGIGYYAYFKPSYFNGFNKTARLFSTIQKSSINTEICVSFWYHMFGIDVNRLNIYLDQFTDAQVLNSSAGFTRTLIWARYGSFGNKWYEGQKTIKSALPWRITYEGVAGKSEKGDIALDDLLSSNGACAPSKSCNFETDMCDYKNNQNDASVDLSWKRGKPNTNLIDHTLSTIEGSFAYVDLSQNVKLNSKARLSSAKYSTNTAECLQFWYLLTSSNGPNQTLLNVYEVNTGNTLKWTKLSNTGDDWKKGQVQIDHRTTSDYQYSIMFESVVQINQLSNAVVGVDDIDIKAGLCDPVVDCNFEGNTICGWQQPKSNDLNWLLNQGQTDTSDTGPHVDVTLGTDQGYYIYVESSAPARYGDKAVLMSDFIEPSDNACFGLWYFMHGIDVGQLNIYMNDSVNGMKLLNNITGEQGFAWQQLLINVTNKNEFRILVQGIVRF